MEPGGVFYFSRVLSEAVDAPTLQIDASERAIAVFLDGKCLYSDGAMDAVIGEVELAELGWKRGAPLLVPLPGDYLGKELTIAQSAGATEGAPSTIYPCAVSLTCGYAYESGLIAESFGTAISAVLLCAAGGCLLAAFALAAWRGHWNWAALCAALFLLLWMAGLLADTSFFRKYHVATRDNTAYLCRCLALSALLMFLASQARRLRALPWTLAALSVTASALTLCIDLSHEIYTDDWSFFLRDAPFQATGFAGLFAALACAWLLWRKEGRFYRWFAPLSAIGLGGLLCAALLQGDEVRRQFQSAFAGQSFAYFLWPLTAMVVGAAAVSAIAELAGQELERRMEARELAERNAMAVASYESLRAQHEQVMMIRHDINRHLHVLRQLSQENAVQAYLDELIGQNEKIPAILHSGNSMIDIILNGRLFAAETAGIAVEIVSAQASETLPLNEADLCSLMLNLIDNAIAAASACGRKQPRIRLDLRVKGDFFVFACENSRHPAGETAQGHGLGLKIVANIVERYNCLMEAEQTEEMYKVTIAMPIN